MRKCLGIKANGARCNYNTKDGFSFCGIHKNQNIQAIPTNDENKNRDIRLVNLISAGAGLITIVEKQSSIYPV